MLTLNRYCNPRAADNFGLITNLLSLPAPYPNYETMAEVLVFLDCYKFSLPSSGNEFGGVVQNQAGHMAKSVIEGLYVEFIKRLDAIHILTIRQMTDK